MAHRLHLLVFCWVDVELLGSKVSQFGVLIFNGNAFLAPVTFVEQICLKEAFQLHNYGREVNSIKALCENYSEEADNSLVKSNIIHWVVLNDTLKLDKAFNVKLLTFF